MVKIVINYINLDWAISLFLSRNWSFLSSERFYDEMLE